MVEEDTTGNCIKPEWDENGKLHWPGIQNQKKSENAKAVLLQPPVKTIPVIFLPGVMGTNLMGSGEGGKNPIWRGDSELKVYGQWAGKSGAKRRDLLNPDTTKVDNRGDINQTIYSPLSDDGKLFPSRRERGWGEVLSFSYGKFLSVLQGALLDDWQQALDNYGKSAPEKKGVLSRLVGQSLSEGKYAEITGESVLTQEELNHFQNFLFPVHVYGYNWLQDNKTSAEGLVAFIDKTIKLYKNYCGHGMPFPPGQEKVIIITHSMGGLVARYASQICGAKDKILGIVHGVIPDLGSPAAYRRMKVGAKQEGMAGAVLGNTAKELMPVLARAPAPLQLLPSAKYFFGAPWLTVEGAGEDGSDVKLPQSGDPFSEIYLNKTLWYRLYESDIIDKDEAVSQSNWTAYVSLVDKPVRKFISLLSSGGYHPNTYAFYGHKIDSDGTLVWKKTSIHYPKNMHESDRKLPNNYREIPLPFNRSQMYVVTSSKTPGDGTVPVESLGAICRNSEIKSVLATHVDHQGAYDVSSLKDIQARPALQFTLRAIVKMVQEISTP
ncbi:acetyltransferase [Citrobacter braakii]|uniref:lipase family alpha/beta hydrolase n=2 Tax=Citrobacter braakii TaxID=57706 RepID=UPI000B9B1935|nr:acetyltransferase [Citrobacter braakii]MCY9801720.1 acetyltransferase [Citrobacter braakii]MDL4386238.1 acetyltransferase [Citrobacter braakii]OXU09036.1 acetyltransferase [Citrobacter braakii]